MRAKRCKDCGVVKTLECYQRNGRGYAQPWCRACANVRKRKRERERRQNEPGYRERKNAERRAWFWDNPGHRAAKVRYLANYRLRVGRWDRMEVA